MTAAELLAYLKSQGIELWIEEDKIRYRGRKMTLPPQLISLLRQHKHELRQLLRTPTPTPTPTEQFPISHSQKRFWFLYQLNPASTAYLVSYAIRIKGRAELPALRQAFGELGQRHPVLRTRLLINDGIPWQQAEERSSCELTAVDAADWTEQELQERVQAESQRPFDLLHDPPARLHIYQHGQAEFVLLLTMPHIHVDGWSFAILVRELAALYRGATTQQPVQLSPVIATYADFVRWHQQLLLSAEGEAQLKYWLNELAGPTPVLELPTDHPRPLVRREAGATIALNLSSGLSSQLKAVALELGTTLYALLLAAFATLLYRYSGQTDLMIGSSFHGRSEPHFERLVGCLINSLVLRIRITSDTCFSTLLEDVARRSRAALTHADYPLQLLVEKLLPDRDQSRTPLFQVMFTYENFQDAATVVSMHPEAEGAAACESLFGPPSRPMLLHQQEGQFDLSLRTLESGDRIVGNLVYNTSLFDHTTAVRMVDHFTQLLKGIAAQRQSRIGALPLLTDAERQQLLVAWNETKTPWTPARSFSELFEAQVAQTPDAAALLYENQSLSYRELNHRANQLAHCLRSLGVSRESLVALYLERSPSLLIGLLAILKAGGAYLPIDPDYPQDRISFMLEDSRPAVVLTELSLLSRLPTSAASTLCLDSPAPADVAIPSFPLTNPEPIAAPSDLAYVIYTSGSSGRPKGTAIEHRGLTNYLLWAKDAYQPAFQGLVPVHSSPAFDLTITSLLLPLLVGGRLQLLPQKDPLSGLINLLKSGAPISLLKITPAHLRLLCQAEPSIPLLSHVSTFVIGGEALDWGLVELCRSQAPRARIFNEYGPTETVVGCSLYEVCGPPRSGSVPIGRPIANTQLYILDSEGQPVPVGVTGQIYIGGLGLGRGYWNRPELTADKFVPNPHSLEPGSRLYKTGDLGRFLPDGNIEFLGRIDSQVKLRGYRIELGEIEAVLATHPDLSDCAVLAREDTPGDKRLIAYVVSRSTPSPDISALRHYLAAKLPEYMLPAGYVFLDTLPQSVNGKLDRKALPAPRPSAGPMGDSPAAPRNSLEQLLADIFSQLLHRSPVGIHDSFFAMGGHSLLATQVMSRILGSLSIDLPLATLFAAPTVAGLASVIAKHQEAAAHEDTAPIVRIPRDAPLPLSFAQKRLWFLDHLDPGRPLYNIPAALRLRGPLDVESLRLAIAEIVRRHESLRTTFAGGEAGPFQHIYQPDAKQPLPIRQLTAPTPDLVEAEILQLVAEEGRRSFSLAQGPLFRPMLLRVSPQDHVLLLTMHHIISDGWSMGVFLRELAVLYPVLRVGSRSPLPELRFQVADISAWQRNLLKGARFEQSLSYWKTQLTGCKPLELPLDRARPSIPSFCGSVFYFSIDAKVTGELKALSQTHGATLFMALLAAFQLLLFRYSGQSDIAVGSPIANRIRNEMEPLIGCFINTLVFRTQVDGASGFLTLLEQVRRHCLDAHEHQQVPFERLVDELRVTRDRSRNPLFQVMFVLQNLPSEGLALPDLAVTPLNIHPGMAKFDLTLALQEAADGSLNGALECATDLFYPATIARLAEHYHQLLAAILEEPSLPCGQLALLNQAQREQILRTWNETKTPWMPEPGFAELFAGQVEQTPEAWAAIYENQTLSYHELNQRANQLAHWLRSHGVGPDVLVALYMERSLELLIGLLGILKAGGAYVPLDPDYPQERINYMLEDARPKVVLTQRRLLDRLAPAAAVTLCLDCGEAGMGVPESFPRENPAPTAASNNLAYVIYTSGSTGRPKGTAIEHRGLTNYLLWAKEAYKPRPQGLVPVHSSAAFDLTVTSLLLPLIAGARVLLLPQKDPLLGLIDLLKSGAAISLLKITPAHLRLLTQAEGSTPLLAGVGTFVIGGEALDWGLVEQCLAQAPQARIFNEYGPTETVVGCSIYEVRSPARTGPVPIGRPIANTQMYILDAQLQPVPIGVTGQIYIGGLGLARGYLNRPELTRDRFIAHPQVSAPGSRLYKTGDLGRYLPDGTIEFLGRVDDQVKLRGYRIELGEIEAVLATHPDVAGCAVLAPKDQPEGQRLIAYVVPRPDRQPAVSSLRAHLSAQLPLYMLPEGFVFLAELPQTVNGKLDRAALPGLSLMRQRESFVPPQTLLEQLLSEIIAQLLNIDRVSRYDNFFALGGHSLLAVRLFAQVAQRTGQTWPLATLFRHPTIAELAAALSARAPTLEHATIVPLQRAAQRPPLFCVHPVGGNVLCYAELARALAQEQLVYGVQAAPVSPQAAAPTETLPELAARYVAELRKVQPKGPYQLLGWSFGGVLAFEMAQQLHHAGQTVSLLALLDSHAPGSPMTASLESVSEESLLAWFLQDFLQQQAGAPKSKLPQEQLTDLPSVLGYLHEKALLSKDTEEAQLRALYAMFRRNLKLLQNYRPKPYAGSIVLLRAQGSTAAAAPDYGWASLCQGSLDIVSAPGDHYTILSRDTAGSVARLLISRLAESAG